MKRFALFLAIVTVAAACSSSSDSFETTNNQQLTVDSSESAGSSQTTQTAGNTPTTTTVAIGDDGASLVPAPTIPPDAPAAPDFTMALADGDTFTLSEQAMPVYMVFWADW